MDKKLIASLKLVPKFVYMEKTEILCGYEDNEDLYVIDGPVHAVYETDLVFVDENNSLSKNFEVTYITRNKLRSTLNFYNNMFIIVKDINKLIKHFPDFDIQIENNTSYFFDFKRLQ